MRETVGALNALIVVTTEDKQVVLGNELGEAFRLTPAQARDVASALLLAAAEAEGDRRVIEKED